MAVTLDLDVHIPRAIVDGLRPRGVDLRTAREEGTDRWTDADLLQHATQQGRVLCMFDDDLLVEAHRLQQAGQPFGGVIFAHPLRLSLGAMGRDLLLIAQVAEPDDMANRVLFLPL